MRVFTWIESFVAKQIAQQHGHLFPWLAVGLGLGIGVYFTLRFEPSLLWTVPLGFACVIGLFCARYLRLRLGVWAPFVLIAGCGFAWASVHAQMRAAPRLDFHYYGPISGRLIQIDRSGSGALRLTLDQVLLSDVSRAQTPDRVRVSVMVPEPDFSPLPGQVLGLTGHLDGPGGPTEPGGFDFQRHAWFLKLGAVGYTRTPVMVLRPPDRSRAIDRLRRQIAIYVSDQLGGDVGGFAAAVTTGDRSAFSQEALQALRISNLAHLLAISGLHMGLLAVFLFGTIRMGLALIQPLALRWPVKKLAALIALLGATGYLLLSGASIATQRAYFMAALALLAVCLDRRALTLRAVSIAALVVLILRPDSLLSPGFQMSFSATAALVFVFSWLKDRPLGRLSGWRASLVGLMVSSVVAGLATAPFAGAHFNQWAAYGLIANLTAVPVMGLVVIPGAVLAAVLSLVGQAWMGLEIMGLGLRWILGVAHWVSALEGARVPIVTPQAGVLPLIALSGCWLILWQGAGRCLGVLGLGLCLGLWTQSDRPDVLISDDGKLVGVLTSEGRVLSKARGQGFIATSWLENDGDLATQALAAARGRQDPDGLAFSQSIAGYQLRHLQGKRGLAAFDHCVSDEILVLDQSLRGAFPCVVFDKTRLRQSGAVALWFAPEGVQIVSVSQKRGQRLWSPPHSGDQ